MAVSIFDPEVGDYDRHRVTVGDWAEMEIGGEKHRLIALNDETDRLNLKIKTYVDADGVMWRQEVPGIMNLVLEKVSEEAAKAEGQPLSLSNRVAVDRPVGDSRTVSRLKLRAALTRSAEGAPFPDTDRQKCVKNADASYALNVGHDQAPAKAGGWPLTVPDDLKPFPLATPIAQSDDENIKRQAQELVTWSATVPSTRCWA